MKDLKKIIHESLGRVLEAQMSTPVGFQGMSSQQPPQAKQTKKKSDDITLPEHCFSGPKKQAGGLVALIQVLMTDHDRNGERAVEEIKRFSEGKSKPDPKEVYKILKKYEKLGQYSGYTGCF